MPKKEFDPIIKELQKKIEEYRYYIKDLKKKIAEHSNIKKNKNLRLNPELILRFD